MKQKCFSVASPFVRIARFFCKSFVGKGDFRIFEHAPRLESRLCARASKNDTNLTNRFLLMTNHWFAFIVIKGFVLLED